MKTFVQHIIGFVMNTICLNYKDYEKTFNPNSQGSGFLFYLCNVL